jgi:hypothetical protein
LEINIDDYNHIEYLPVADTTGLLQKIRAAIFLSLDELWSAPSNFVQIATILDPRFKNFKWINTSKEREKPYKLLQVLYDSIKGYFQTRDISTQQTTSIHDNIDDDDDDFFQVLENKELSGNFSIVEEENEVLRYIKIQQIDINQDPLKWWNINKSGFPVLSQLAQKYLSIPATSVPSERLFLDAGNYISAKRTQLSPDLVNQVLFLKRNSEHFDMFQPKEL